MTNSFHFSQRTNWELSSNKITTVVDSLKKDNVGIINLTESNPTQCGFGYPKRILKSLYDKKNFVYAPDAQGLLEARRAICEYYNAQQLDVRPEQIFLTSSTSEAYSYLFRLLADPDDEFLFPRPSYPLFQFLGDLNDITLGFYPLRYLNQWVIDFEALDDLLTAKTKGVVLVNPNNPTGSFIKAYELEALNQICQKHHLSIICDEVFHDFSFSTHQKYLSLVNNKSVLTFVLSGLSKTLGLPQMKLSWIVMSGPDSLVEDAKKRLEVIADTYLSVNTPVQQACGSWLKYHRDLQQQILKRIRQNLHLLQNFASKGIYQLLNAEGGWYAVLKLFPNHKEEEIVLECLDRDHVFIHPGYFFDFPDEPYLVLSLLPQEDIFEKGVLRVLSRISQNF